MTIENENVAAEETPTDLDTGAQTGADTGATDGSRPDGEDKPTIDEEARNSFLQGVEQAKATPGVDLDNLPSKATTDAKNAADTTADAAAAKAKGTAPAAAPATDKPGAKKPPEPTDAEKLAKATTDAEIQKEIIDAGLKPGSKAATRFHEMATTIRSQAPIVDEMKKLKIESPAQLQDVMQAAARGVEWENTVLQSTATPQQFAEMLGVVQLINSGDVTNKNKVFDHLLGVVKTLGTELGRTVEGVINPLDQHPDLKQAVENQDITPEYAAELARQRATDKLRGSNEQQRQQQDSLTQAQQSGIAQAKEFEARMQAADPHYAAKFQALLPTIQLIRRSVHPSQWAKEIATAYAALPDPVAAAPAPAAPAARVRAGHVPARPGMAAASTVKQLPKNDRDAFLMGVEAASHRS